jgi:thiamine kinase-like enzyme
MEWADFSLKGLELEHSFLNNHDQVILHGDLAHHNFIRGIDSELYLIDFDLVSIGSPACDYLQYCNRILPSLEWSLHDLTEYEQIQPYLNNRGFLYALLFPTDIFREWNRLIKDRQYSSTFQVRQVLDLTVRQFFSRQSFVEQVKLLLEE